LRLLPTEYLYYYYRARDAYRNAAQAGSGRGAVIERLNVDLFARLRGGVDDPVAAYAQYLARRNAGYMQIESGAAGPLERSPWAAATGYDKIALQVVRAIHFNLGSIVPLNVPNRGNLPDLADDDIVEVPSVVNANGALPMHVGPVPDAARRLLVQVKEYERLTVRAALSADRDAAVRALTRNPLVPSLEIADRLVGALLPS